MSTTSVFFSWWRGADPNARRSLIAAALGWMLDAFDVMIYAMVLSELMSHFSMSKPTAGLLASLTLVSSALGGFIFGLIADRFGRRRALVWSIIVYSVFTAACGLSRTILMLAVFRVCLGLGMGGEWASGASLVSETWPAAHRGKALGLVQSSWAVGYAAAAGVAALVLPRWGWRAVFFVGVLPALLTVWVQKKVREPEIWERHVTEVRDRKMKRSAPLREIFSGPRLKITVLVTLMNAATMFGWWGLNLWIPAYLTSAADRGGAGLGVKLMSGFVIFMQAGMWLGYVSFGFLSDRFGRKRSYVFFLVSAALAVLLYSRAGTPLELFLLGPLVAYFGTGHFSGFGTLTAELYPTSVRATAQGITYNAGRIVSAVSPFVVGSLAASRGFSFAFLVVGLSFLVAALFWSGIPETKGRELT